FNPRTFKCFGNMASYSRYTAPGAVADLLLSGETDSEITVSFTAPGDDGVFGTATSYDLRYSLSEITEGNWADAAQVDGEPIPSVAGSLEIKMVSGLSPNATYYFALKTSDEVPNESSLSNVPNSATEINTHVLTYTASANGSVTGTSPQTVDHGSSGTEVTAVANSNYHFTSWSDGVTTAARTDTNATADISVTANFEADVVAPPEPPPSGGGGSACCGGSIGSSSENQYVYVAPPPAVVSPPLAVVQPVQPEIQPAPEPPAVAPTEIAEIVETSEQERAIEQQGETRPPENLNADFGEVGSLEASPETTAPPKQTFFAAALSNFSNIVMPIISAVINFFKNLRWK
ncbi:MAG: hypothetical protein AAB925_00330, partial [Patescibacteria group bacterium]